MSGILKVKYAKACQWQKHQNNSGNSHIVGMDKIMMSQI